jgi:hypothetical protein
MSERSAYLRDQAEKCRLHADRMTDAETIEQLRKLAVAYIERAARVDNAGIEDNGIEGGGDEDNA